MPFVYDVMSGATYTTSSTPNTESPFMALRQATRGFDLQAIFCVGKAGAATTISGIGVRVRRWLTAGSGGTAVTPNPRRLGTTASTIAVDGQSAITPGTGGGTYQLGFGFGKAGPGGWMARDADSMVHVEGGSADELAIYSHSGEASLPFEANAEIVE